MTGMAYDGASAVLRELGAARRLGVERVPLVEAVGRVVARAVKSRARVPPFDNSAMDGFALRAAWVAEASREAPVVVPLAGAVFAGDAPRRAPAARAAVEVMTGAPMPAGFDAVVKVEDVAVDRAAGRLTISSPVARGAHLRRAGEDFTPGQPALAVGARLAAEHLLALAAIGVREVEVVRRPRVVVLSTGKELVPHGTAKLRPGQIRNSTAPFLEAAFAQRGAEVRDLGVVADDVPHFTRVLKRALKTKPDLIITTGAVSVGRADFVAEALRALGAEVLFHTVAIRPGKPLLCARFAKGPVVLGLPGNPVATAVGVRFFADVLLRALAGRAPEPPRFATLEAATRKPPGLRCFFKGRLSHDGGSVRVLEGQASFMVSPLLEADCWVELPEAGGEVAGGATVRVHALEERG